MKMIIKSAVVLGVAALAVTTVLGKGSKGGGGQGTHTIRFTFKAAFTNASGGGTNAIGPSGTATGSESINVVNNTDRETLNVTLKGLTPSSPFSLFGTTTNGSTDAADFNSDKNGNAKVTLSSKPGKKGIAIGSLDPLHQLTELDIVDDTASNTVMSADLTAPATFTFQDKQSQPGAGTLTVSASNKNSPKLSLKATGLTAGDSFTLSGVTASNATFTATSKGTLSINTPISDNVLDLTEVDLTDTTTSTTVLTFPMP
jgi:hypothetical protein